MRTCSVLYAVIYLTLVGSALGTPRHAIGEHYHPIAYGRSGSGSPPNSEIEALRRFYVTTGGNAWYSNKGWLVGNPCSDWFGVVCNYTSNSVSAILLTRNNLLGTLPSDTIAALTELEVLDVSYNSLSGSIPNTMFSTLPRMREIYFNNNAFNGTLDFFDSLPITMEVLYIPENSFSGTLPSSLGNFTKVYNFQMFSNELSGTIPPEIGNMLSLKSLDFGFNSFVGSIPDSIGNLVNLQFFWMYDDELNGTLPESIGNLKELQIFEVTRNQLEGGIPQSFTNLESLRVLRLGGNNFSGTPSPICSMLNLTDALLYSNKFTGIPPCKYNTFLTMLLMSDNELKGDIPSELGNLVSLKRIDLSHNQITGTVPATFTALAELLLLDFSHNNMSGTLEDMLLPLARLNRITSVDVSHNDLYGEIPYSIVWNDSTQEELSKSVTYLYINNNRLSGDIPDYLSWMYRLQYADLSHNNFTGPIPEALSYLSTLYVEGNEYMVGENGGALPSFLVPDDGSVMKYDGGYSCPGLKGKDGEYLIEVDPSYFNKSLCTCEPTFWGVNGTCSACPQHARCPGGKGTQTHIIVNPGYFPMPNNVTPQYMLTCSKDNFGFTPCNPSASYPFQCKPGYEGHLCSKCTSNHFSRGIECIECLSTGKRAVVLAVLVVVVTAIYMFFLFSKPRASIPSAARKTAMFYFQALNLLLTRFAGWPAVFAFLSTISSAFNFGFNYTCVIFDFFDIFYATLAIPLYSVAINAIMIGFVYFVRYIFAQPVDIERWVNGSIRIIILTLNFMYLPLCTNILSMFVCIEDSHTSEKYLAVAPWIRCNGSSSNGYAAAVSVAAICFVIYVLGIPALFAYILYRFRDRLSEHRVIASIGSLYVDYTERTYYFELAGLFRRFLFALVIAVVKQGDLFLISSILFFVLVAYAIVTVRFKPFNYRLSNTIEILALGVLTFNLVGILAATSKTSTTATAATFLTTTTNDKGNTEAVVMQVFVLLANLAFILVLLGALFFGISHMVLPHQWRSNMEGVTGLRYLSKVQTRAFDLPSISTSKKRHVPTIIVHPLEEEGEGEGRAGASYSPSSTSTSTTATLTDRSPTPFTDSGTTTASFTDRSMDPSITEEEMSQITVLHGRSKES